MTYADYFENERKLKTQDELVDSIIGQADIDHDCACACAIAEQVVQDNDALIELMSVGIDLDVTSVQKLTVHQLMTLASYALDLRNSVVNSLKQHHNLECLAGEK